MENKIKKNDSKAKETKKKRKLILKNLFSGKMDTLEQKVAWILNNYPEARDSDIVLQLKYWGQFETDIYNGSAISSSDLFKLTKLTSIARARAALQNTYNLFQASEKVRKNRGLLQEEEKSKAVEQKRNYPVFVVFADESGKTGKNLIVGSMWVVDGYETLQLFKSINEWKNRRSFDKELHFSKITRATLPYYKEVVDLLKSKASLIGFKTISVENSGISDTQNALADLFYLLLVKGIEHENSTGRACLPRTLQFFKDADEKGTDKLLLANLQDKLKQASSTRFDNKLELDQFEALDSKDSVLIQIADLFTGSVNRLLNSLADTKNHKDEFAEYFLNNFGVVQNLLMQEVEGDMTLHISL